MQLYKCHVKEKSNSQIVLQAILTESTPKTDATISSEKFIVVAFCVVVTVFTIALVVGIHALVSFVWGRVTVSQLVSGVSVAAAIAASAITLFHFIKLVQSGRRLFQAFWDSLELE